MTPARKALNETIIPEFSKRFTEKDKVLFVGVDSVWDYKHLFKAKYQTLDIKESTKPDIVADIQDCYQIEDYTYNGVIMTGVWEYLEDKKSALSEIKRITKKNGLVLLCVPARGYYPEANRHFSFSQLSMLDGFQIEKVYFTYYRYRQYYYHFFLKNDERRFN